MHEMRYKLSFKGGDTMAPGQNYSQYPVLYLVMI